MISQWKSDFVKNASVVFERNKDEAGKLRKEMEEKESRKTSTATKVASLPIMTILNSYMQKKSKSK
jgi:hypothetical protein